jgi:hypothetical protein
MIRNAIILNCLLLISACSSNPNVDMIDEFLAETVKANDFDLVYTNYFYESDTGVIFKRSVDARKYYTDTVLPSLKNKLVESKSVEVYSFKEINESDTLPYDVYFTDQVERTYVAKLTLNSGEIVWQYFFFYQNRLYSLVPFQCFGNDIFMWR